MLGSNMLGENFPAFLGTPVAVFAGLAVSVVLQWFVGRSRTTGVLGGGAATGRSQNMKSFGRNAWLRAPGARASCARAVSLTIPTCCDVVPAFPTFENLWRGTVRLVLHLIHPMFCPVAEIWLRPCGAAAPGFHGELAGIRPNRRNLTIGWSHFAG